MSTIKLTMPDYWHCTGQNCGSTTFHIDWRGLYPVAICTKCGEREELR